MEGMIREFYGFAASSLGRDLDSTALLERAMKFKVTESQLQEMAERYHRGSLARAS
jgi:hypothetical protein